MIEFPEDLESNEAISEKKSAKPADNPELDNALYTYFTQECDIGSLVSRFTYVPKQDIILYCYIQQNQIN